MNEKILFVDDEANILQAYSRTLRKQFNLLTAMSGKEGLEKARSEGPFAVVVSDMKMPEMDGAQFLAKMKESHPNTVRIMLTGNADQQTAISAVNEGDVFRFLNKPCSAENMAQALNEAIDKYRRVSAERELLEKTVKGSIEALAEALSMAKPEVFGRTVRYKQLMLDCAKQLGAEDDWQIETIAMLSLIGTISVPDELVRKVLSGVDVSGEEIKQFNRHAQTGATLIGKIPRMEKLAESILHQCANFDGSGVGQEGMQKGAKIPLGGRLLRAIIDFDRFERRGLGARTALGKLEQTKGYYDPEVVAALTQVVGNTNEVQAKEIGVLYLNENMLLASDVRTKDGALLVCKGQQMTPSVTQRLVNFWRNGAINEKVMVIVQDQQTSAADRYGSN